MTGKTGSSFLIRLGDRTVCGRPHSALSQEVTMLTDKEGLKEEKHHYPFLVDDVFDFRTGKLRTEPLRAMIGEYLTRHLRKEATKKGGSANETLEFVIAKLVDGCSGKDIFGTAGALSDIASNLEHGDDVELLIGLTNVKFGLKRFGLCVGVRALDARDSVHENATEILEKLAMDSTHECRFRLVRFVRCWRVLMSRWRVYGGGAVNVAAELSLATRYVPDVKWYTDVGTITSALLEDYIVTDHKLQYCGAGGVEVGRYHDIPVYAQILFGGEESNKVWRRGSVTREGSTLVFDSNSTDHPIVQYFTRISNGFGMFKKAESGVDYMREQRCHHRLAEVLLNAFSARDLAETIAMNPHLAAWREKPAESAQA